MCCVITDVDDYLKIIVLSFIFYRALRSLFVVPSTSLSASFCDKNNIYWLVFSVLEDNYCIIPFLCIVKPKPKTKKQNQNKIMHKKLRRITKIFLPAKHSSVLYHKFSSNDNNEIYSMLGNNKIFH